MCLCDSVGYIDCRLAITVRGVVKRETGGGGSVSECECDEGVGGRSDVV